MAIKYDGGRVRLWKSEKEERPGIGIKFKAGTSKREIIQVFKAIDALLSFKHGKGIE